MTPITIHYRSGKHSDFELDEPAARGLRRWAETGTERSVTLSWPERGVSLVVVRDAVEFIEFGGTP